MSERRFLVTGSSGHLGEALVRTLRRDGVDVVGIDIAAARPPISSGRSPTVAWWLRR
ncbi:hypothetical protein L830_4998 [Mycobacteroides abscessus MAB_082312_2258]|nr:hypothetical protein L830_4998 [Mycobacteroides abscessus MAB_082312_2258]